MKAERWYDVKCDICKRHLSTDYQAGKQATAKEAVKTAKIIGFKDTILGTACPMCRRDTFHEDIDCSRWQQ